MSTMIGCLDAPAVIVGDRFWTLMKKARSWSIDNDVLTIYFADGSEAELTPLSKRKRLALVR